MISTTSAKTGETTTREMTPDEVAANTPDPADLAAWRETADMDKGAFCIGLRRLGVLAKGEGKSAAKGDWPATFKRLLTQMSEDEAEEVEIAWAATTRVRRMHPILLKLVPMSPLTDEQVDAMFGWVG